MDGWWMDDRQRQTAGRAVVCSAASPGRSSRGEGAVHHRLMEGQAEAATAFWRSTARCVLSCFEHFCWLSNPVSHPTATLAVCTCSTLTPVMNIQNIDRSLYVQYFHRNVCLNTLRIEGKEESTYRQGTGCKMVTEALNVVKRQRFDFLSSVLTATPGDRLTVKQLLGADRTTQTQNDQNRNKWQDPACIKSWWTDVALL